MTSSEPNSRQAVPGSDVEAQPEVLRQAAKSTDDYELFNRDQAPAPATDFTDSDMWRVLRIQAEFVHSFEVMSKVGPAVTIFGSARLPDDDTHCVAARQICRQLAGNGWAIITGGGPGIMKAAPPDLSDGEPLPPGHPFFSLPNVLLSPHCADHTPDWLERAMCFFLEQFERYRTGTPLKNVVDKHRGY